MEYLRIYSGKFIERPNRFIAYVEIEGKPETVHVKNTGRCAELLIPGVTVYVQKSDNPERKTAWDLIAVKKGERIINMDSQIPNYVVKEWLEKEKLFQNIRLIKPEKTYGKSRIDLYVEYGADQRAYIEVKGVTLENADVVLFPDAPSERALKHVEELIGAVEEGYEAYLFFVIQMKKVKYFTPNRVTQPAFAEALIKAKKAGVKIVAYDCTVKEDSIQIDEPVPVILEDPVLYEMTTPVVEWYRENKRDLPWRSNVSAYKVWLSEIMLQQTRVEAVKPYFQRFLENLPTIRDLAEVDEDKLFKLWEGLGYYNRVRNMQKAAQMIMEEYDGKFPSTFEEIRKLPGIGSYTAGAVSAFAFGIPKPAVDGNVLRVITRVLKMREDITKASVKKKIEGMIEDIIPQDCPADFDQGLIELGALVCVPNGEPKCEKCPVRQLCGAYKEGIQTEFPVKAKAKERKIEKRTVLIIEDEQKVAIRKRPSKGLLAGLYEFPNVSGWLSAEEIVEYCKEIGLMPVQVREIGDAKHVFSHIEWKMKGYAVRVDELEKNCKIPVIFAESGEISSRYSIPSAFEKYAVFAECKDKKSTGTD